MMIGPMRRPEGVIEISAGIKRYDIVSYVACSVALFLETK